MVIKKNVKFPGPSHVPLQKGRLFCLSGTQLVPLFTLSLFLIWGHIDRKNRKLVSSLHNNQITRITFFHGNIPILYVSLVPLFFYANITCLAKGMRINCTGPSILVSWGKRIKLSPILVDKQKYLYYFFYLGHGNLNFYLSFSYNILNEESRMTSSW